MRETTAILLIAFILAPAATLCGAEADPDHPAKPRELYNDGTQMLRAGKLADAEVRLQDAIARQDARVQPPALYNLGLARFRDGENERTNAPDPKQLQSSLTRTAATAADALRAGDAALAGDDVQAMVDAYLRGRGARRELKAASEAVKRALDTYNSVLTKWRRASGDFKSSAELSPDRDAEVNGDLMDRRIAWLVDQVHPLMQSRDQLAQMNDDMRKLLQKLKGKVPQDVGEKMPSDDGDDDEDGNPRPRDLKPNQGEEGPVKAGQQMQLTPEEARRLLGLLRLDAGHQLPQGNGDQATPQERKGRDW